MATVAAGGPDGGRACACLSRRRAGFIKQAVRVFHSASVPARGLTRPSVPREASPTARRDINRMNPAQRHRARQLSSS